MTLGQIAGVLPAIVFPTATALQLLRTLRTDSAAGVSISSWTMFGVANVALYLYTGRYTEWQAISGLLLTAVLDFAIVGVALVGRSTRRTAATGTCSATGKSQAAAHEREEKNG